VRTPFGRGVPSDANDGVNTRSSGGGGIAAPPPGKLSGRNEDPETMVSPSLKGHAAPRNMSATDTMMSLFMTRIG